MVRQYKLLDPWTHRFNFAFLSLPLCLPAFHVNLCAWLGGTRVVTKLSPNLCPSWIKLETPRCANSSFDSRVPHHRGQVFSCVEVTPADAKIMLDAEEALEANQFSLTRVSLWTRFCSLEAELKKLDAALEERRSIQKAGIQNRSTYDG